jgi:polyisoprenoid-binding protein YceI
MKTLALFLGGLLGSAHAAPLAINLSGSQLSFTADYGGEPIEGEFKRFDGQIEYAASNPLQTRFVVNVEVGSVDSGDEERDGYLRGSEWFAAEAHPVATFSTGNDCSSFEGRLSCAGELKLKGKRAPVTIEVQFAGDGSSLTGMAQLQRTVFGIGEGEWADTGTIGDVVQVQFKVLLKPAG